MVRTVLIILSDSPLYTLKPNHLIFIFHLFLKDGESKIKSKNDTGKGKGKKKKKRKTSDEALEDSDDGDYEGLEVDYMSDESRSDP